MKKNKKNHDAVKEEPKSSVEPPRSEFGYLYIVKNPSSNELSYCAFDHYLEKGTHVIAPTRYGLDYALVVGLANSLGEYQPGPVECIGLCTSENGNCYGNFNLDEEKEKVKIEKGVDWIDRKASEEDYKRYQKLTQMEDEALSLCREKVEAHKLDMKLVAAHYLFEEPKILFFFTAANRVDFRELVKDLVGIFRIRIELRQIGVRDEARLLGGMGVCGRDYCCHGVTDKLKAVSIKMAKEQSLSLNSTKISGPCGRLLCCLSYEYDFYLEEKQNLPPEGSRLKVQHELMRITEVNILSKKISLTGHEGRYLTIPFSAVQHNKESSRWEIKQSYLEEFLSN